SRARKPQVALVGGALGHGRGNGVSREDHRYGSRPGPTPVAARSFDELGIGLEKARMREPWLHIGYRWAGAIIVRDGSGHVAPIPLPAHLGAVRSQDHPRGMSPLLAIHVGYDVTQIGVPVAHSAEDGQRLTPRGEPVLHRGPQSLR